MDSIQFAYESRNVLSEVMDTINPCFYSKRGREQARKYILGLLSDAERKNGWQMAEAVGDTSPWAIQQFLYRGVWDADRVRDLLQEYVMDNIGETDGVLLIDEIGFLKQGKKSAGVQRQYNKTAGRSENCQLGIFLNYASRHGHNWIDRRLYLPQAWTDDRARCAAAGIPETAEYRTKPQLALDSLRHARERLLPFSWVTGDGTYGEYPLLRKWLESESIGYVLEVSPDTNMAAEAAHKPARAIWEAPPEADWRVADIDFGEPSCEWVSLPYAGHKPGWQHCELIARCHPQSMRAFACFYPEGTPPERLAHIAGLRVTVGKTLRESKRAVGLDQYEIRSYPGWYKHITMACLAQAVITVVRHRTREAGTLPVTQQNSKKGSLARFKLGRGIASD